MATELIDEQTHAMAMSHHAADNLELANTHARARMEVAVALDEVATAYENVATDIGSSNAMREMSSTLGRAGNVAKMCGYEGIGKGGIAKDLHAAADDMYNHALYEILVEHDPETQYSEIERFGAVLASSHYVRSVDPEGCTGNFDLVGSKSVPLNVGKAYFSDGVAKAVEDMKVNGDFGLKYLVFVSDSEELQNTNCPNMDPRGITDVICETVDNGQQAIYIAKQVEIGLSERQSFSAKAAFDRAFRASATQHAISLKDMSAPVRRIPEVGEQLSFNDIDPEFNA